MVFQYMSHIFLLRTLTAFGLSSQVTRKNRSPRMALSCPRHLRKCSTAPFAQSNNVNPLRVRWFIDVLVSTTNAMIILAPRGSALLCGLPHFPGTLVYLLEEQTHYCQCCGLCVHEDDGEAASASAISSYLAEELQRSSEKEIIH